MTDIRNARQQVRVLRSSTIPEPPSAQMKTWTGSAFVDSPVKLWNGTAFVDATGVKTYNGTAFVP